MSKPPARRPSSDPRSAAEALFKAGPQRLPDPPKGALPQSREQVSLRIDRDILEHFQQDGPGWQERINEFLRKALPR